MMPIFAFVRIDTSFILKLHNKIFFFNFIISVDCPANKQNMLRLMYTAQTIQN